MRPAFRRHRSVDIALLCLLLAGIAANVLAMRAAKSRAYTIPPPTPLPLALQEWKGALLPDSDSYRWIIPHARTTAVEYTQNGLPPIILSIIASRDPNDMHTPDRCIMGSGFEVASDELRQITAPGPDGGSWPFHRLVIRQRDYEEVVLYGYDGIHTIGGSTLMARVAMKLGGARKDPAYFVRFSTPTNGDAKAAETRLMDFATEMMRVRRTWQAPKRT